MPEYATRKSSTLDEDDATPDVAKQLRKKLDRDEKG
jgi:hypothetical protein